VQALENVGEMVLQKFPGAPDVFGLHSLEKIHVVL
jgi:hypothetical protein